MTVDLHRKVDQITETVNKLEERLGELIDILTEEPNGKEQAEEETRANIQPKRKEE